MTVANQSPVQLALARARGECSEMEWESLPRGQRTAAIYAKLRDIDTAEEIARAERGGVWRDS